ncbi:conserved hypothetical protein [Leishmania mexicana MHOM/GT/2001/U1103]|uniref:Uncharacterized protein n=1 Tax=Leishmania mexicana (strain MHOM/GT/2001/U1103) TaxID=929439 RepID=E9AQ26_LEIMU|nr:conserved hypothetical protein [Leishmania mexicana MHOM/GT/2001/U1103]CBZ25044.1 conserved hypothetical protein [Leishmania mexicana MHOM/GT/2001/U1103]
MRASTDGPAARTVADLDKMDDKLRRLGLDVDRPTTTITPPSFALSSAHGSADYIHSIRAAKAEKQQVRLDKLARLAVVAEKQQSSSSVAVAAAAASSKTGSVTDTSRADHATVGDKALLASDVADAALRASEKSKSDLAQQLRTERMLKVAADHQQSHTEEHDQLVSMPLSSNMVSHSLTVTAPEWRERRRQEAVVWCAGVARGLAELAIEVSDSRHLPATGLGGRPVYRLHQDLSVTQWRQWLEKLVFPTSLSAAAAEIKPRSDDGAAGIDSEVADSSVSRSADAQQTLDASLQLEAAKCITSVTEAEAQEAVRAQAEAVTCVLAKLHAEVACQRKAAEEAVRLAADEANLPAPQAAEGDAGVAGTLRREELLPGWTQRMPPAACLVYGDDLSGARLLTETIEMCAQRKSHQHQPSSSQSPHRRLAASRQYSLGTGEGPEPSAADSSPTAPVEDFFSHFVVSEIGVECSDPALAEGGAVATYVTPRTLLGSGALGAGGGDAKRSGSAGRLQRAQQHSSGGGGNPGGGGGASQGVATTVVTGSSSSSSVSRFSQRVNALSAEGRRESEQLIEAVVREVVRVHRHNLGVLAGDRMPSWAPKPTAPAPAPAAGLVATAEEIGQSKAAALGSVPLRTLFLVGFSDSASFVGVLARRLRQATAVAETELMEMEGRRCAAEQQAAVAAAAAESCKQRTSPPVKGAKGASPGPPRSKSNRLAKAVAGVEEQAVSAMVEELQATIAMPPLGVLATFLVYDLPTRQRRLEAASFATDAAVVQRASGDDCEDDLNNFSGVGGGALLRSAGPEYTHPVYNPSPEDIQSFGPPSTAKEFSPARPISVRPGSLSAGSPSPSLPSPPSPAGAASTVTTASTLCVQTWNVERLRTELKQQHAQQQRQRKDWMAAVEAHAHRESVESVSGGLLNAGASFRPAVKRRDKPTASMSSNFASASLDLERANSIPRRASMSTMSRAAESSAMTAGNLLEEKGLPRALFFVCVQDVSDPTTPLASSVDSLLDPTNLGTAIWRAAATSQFHAVDLQHGCAEARVRTVNELTAQLRLLHRPAAGRVLTNESLAPRQLAEPFRLGDYRLTEATRVRLKKTSKAFLGTLPAAPALHSFEKSDAFPGEAVAAAARDALAAEAEVWATVLQHAEQLHHLVAEVFMDRVAQPECPVALPAAATLSTTARFTSIDQSYAREKEAIAVCTAYAIAHLEDCLALLLRFSVDVCLGQLAASVRLLCCSIARHHRVETDVLFDVASSVLVSSGTKVDEEVLRVAPRLSAEAARALINSLRSVNASEASATLSAELAAVYWPQVTAVAAEVAVQYFKGYSLHNLAGDAFSVTNTPQPPQQTQVVEKDMECARNSNAGAANDAAVSTLEANISVAEHVPAAVQLLLEQAINAPAPLARVALLLQESQRMVCAARDGAEAWVELLYREVLGMHATAPVSTVSRARRPRSLDELADGPLAVLHIGDDEETNLRQPSPWRCGQLELLLSSVRPAKPNAMVSMEKFERGLLVHQLQRLWRFLPDISVELAAKAKYSMRDHEAKTPAPTTRLVRPATFSSATSGPLALPDPSLDAYLLTSCPCRPSAESHFPFLTTADVERLSAAAAAAEVTSTAAAGKALVVVDLELWLANLALRRCCFCAKCDAPTAGADGGEPELAAVQTSQCMRACAAIPSSGAVRHTIATLPACVLAQYATFCTTAMPSLPSLVTTPPPSLCEMPVEWMLVQWWWRAWCSEDAWSQSEDVQRCYALWRILLGHAPPSPPSSPNSAASTPSTMAPLLSSLLRLLVGIGRHAGATEERVRRAFHCLAALRRVATGALDTRTATTEENADVDAAMTIEDSMILTVAECAALGRLLSPAALTVGSNAPVATTSATEAAAAVSVTSEREVRGHQFITDVQLLLQVEGTKGVTLPLLLSSRWASLLMTEHF